jgi:hypothetical protein
MSRPFACQITSAFGPAQVIAPPPSGQNGSNPFAVENSDGANRFRSAAIFSSTKDELCGVVGG